MTHAPFGPKRYRSAAEHYEKGRAAYAPALIRRVTEVTGLGLQHRVLDLGCGPGPLARVFAPLVREVLAIDPSPEMLAEARVLAGQTANIRFVPGSSYELDPALGHFHLVVMGRSFHWMDRVDTLERLNRLIEPSGAVALFYDSAPAIPANAWRKTWKGIRERYEPNTGHTTTTPIGYATRRSCSTRPSPTWNALAWSNAARSTSRRWCTGRSPWAPRRPRTLAKTCRPWWRRFAPRSPTCAKKWWKPPLWWHGDRIPDALNSPWRFAERTD